MKTLRDRVREIVKSLVLRRLSTWESTDWNKIIDDATDAIIREINLDFKP